MAPLLLAAAITAAATACPTVRLVWSPGWAQLNASSAPDNKGGLEDGIVVRRADGGFSMVSAEMWTDPHWVAMRLGVWKSTDALHWVKQRTLRQSTGKFDGGPHSATCTPRPPSPPQPTTLHLPATEPQHRSALPSVRGSVLRARPGERHLGALIRRLPFVPR